MNPTDHEIFAEHTAEHIVFLPSSYLFYVSHCIRH